MDVINMAWRERGGFQCILWGALNLQVIPRGEEDTCFLAVSYLVQETLDPLVWGKDGRCLVIERADLMGGKGL